jgi:hypothetical protein
MLTQLGVDDIGAIVWGSLSGKSQFFGSNTSEIVSLATTYGGGWDSSYAESAFSASAWFMMSGEPPNAERSGVFAFARRAGEIQAFGASHRTILSGY